MKTLLSISMSPFVTKFVCYHCISEVINKCQEYKMACMSCDGLQFGFQVEAFMQRRQVQNFTFILEWGKGLVHWRSTHGHISGIFSLHAAYSAMRHFLEYMKIMKTSWDWAVPSSAQLELAVCWLASLYWPNQLMLRLPLPTTLNSHEKLFWAGK